MDTKTNLIKASAYLLLLSGAIFHQSHAIAPTIEIASDKNLLRDVKCLARVLYDEARGEGFFGMFAVANVVLNRRDSWGMSVCQVVFHKRKGRYQFSGMGKPLLPYTDEAFNMAYDFLIMNRYEGQDITDGATFFHANYVKPNWSKVYDRTAVVGRHYFYRSNQILR
jgi:spore germination cell wall hydrolase CwlJ-like protein